MTFAQGTIAFSTVGLVYASELLTTDFNRDAVADLLVASAAPPLQLSGVPLRALVGLGNGVFFENTAVLLSSFPPSAINPSAIVSADFNADGIADFFVADAGRRDQSPSPGAQNALALSTGAGTWFNATALNLPAQTDVTATASAADIDGNGAIDLYVGNVDGFLRIPPAVLVNDGTGSFAADASRLPTAVQDLSRSHTAASFIDANADGRSDLFLGGGAGTASVLLQNLDGIFSLTRAGTVPGKAFGNDSVDTAAYSLDITGDALPDLLVANTSNDFVGRALQVFVNRGGFAFTDETVQRVTGVNAADAGIRKVFFADFDRDGAIDLLLEPARGPAQLLLNDGEGHFFAPLDSVLAGIDGPLAVGDFNGDGNQDIASWGGSPSTTLTFFAGDSVFLYRTTGTERDDLLFGTTRADLLAGLAGNDVIRGGSGNDTLQGGEGGDELHGGGGDDRLEGGDGNDSLDGGAGSDTIRGEAGNDSVAGLEGIDAIDGGTGIDALRLEGVFRQYRLTGDAKVDARIARGADSAGLTAMENIQWVDGRLTFDPDDHFAQTYRLYFSALGRAPDALGIDWWSARLDAGESLLDVARGMLASPEAQSLYSGLSDAQFVQTLYLDTLDRPAEPDGRAYWIERLQGGASRAEVVLAFSASPEHLAHRAAAIDAGLFDFDQSSASIARIYYGALERDPEVQGLVYWSEQLKSGASLLQVGEAIAASDEFRNLYGSLPNDAFIAALYERVLHRAPEASGLDFWLQRLNAGLDRGTVTLGFTESLEHQLATLAKVEHGLVVADPLIV